MSLQRFVSLAVLLGGLVGCTKLEPGRVKDGTRNDGGDTTLEESGVTAPPDGDGGETESGSDSDAGIPGPTAMLETCTKPDALRCAAQAGQTERCSNGEWSAHTPCAAGEVCTTQPNPGTCQAVTEICRGSAGQAVCDGRGVMYLCNAQGIASSQETCMSAQHCQMGTSGNKCLACIPSSYRCSDTRLDRCKPDGSGYEMTKTCATAALCNAQVGDCTTTACTPGGATCAGDVLRRCNTAQTGYEDVGMCSAGLCDATNGQCDMCSAGSKSCSGDSVVTCSTDGQGTSAGACPTATPKCVGVGKCVQCASDANCGDPGTCRMRYCNVATGSCEPQNQPARTTCPGGLCDGSGNCRACLQDNDCGNPGECRTRYCNPATRACEPRNTSSGTICAAGYCDGNGSCVGCIADDSCGDPGECRVAHCNPTSRTCEPRNAPSTTACGTGGRHCYNGSCVQCANTDECADRTCNTKSCSASGQCVYTPIAAGETCSGGVCTSSQTCRECESDAQCNPRDTACTDYYCTNNVCASRNKTGACGTLKVCSGGSCVNSCPNGAVDTAAGEECEIGVATATDWSCTSGCRLTGFQNSGLAAVCTADSQCGPNLTCDATWFPTAYCFPRCTGSQTNCTLPAGYGSLGACSQGLGPGGRSCLINCRSNATCPAGARCSASNGSGICLTP